MGMSTHVVGVRPPDDAWKKHKAVWDACMEANVPVPKATLDFFEGEDPDDAGVLAELSMDVAVEWSDGGSAGFEVHIEKLPEGVKRLRFYNSW